MADYIKYFRQLGNEDFKKAGGKGGTLSLLIQKDFPVPDGFVIFPFAFQGVDLKPAAWEEIKKAADTMKQANAHLSFAVRSSALAEDSAYASFAGEFETVLDVRSEDALRAAVLQVQRSRESERVKAYSKEKGIDSISEIAVVVQQLIRADISGILFTADPVSGNRFEMMGNYIFGFGEELVSGEVEPYTFSISYPGGRYDGPDDFKEFSPMLFKLAKDLEEEFSCAQDIEWVIADGKLYLLQSRPITTLKPYDPLTGEWNHSKTGDYVWVGNEVFPEVMTPATWSVFRYFQAMNIYNIPIMGNIHGRFYMNFSLAFKMFELMNKSEEYMADYIVLTTGHELGKVTIPELSLSKGQVLKAMLPKMVTMLPKQFMLMGKFEQIVEENPKNCESVIEKIRVTSSKGELAEMWEKDVYPLFWDLLQVQDKANEDYFYPYLSAKINLYKLIGKEASDKLLSKMTGRSSILASIQLLVGLQRLSKGEITPEEYELTAGHRPEFENEVSTPRLYERDGWIEERLVQYRKDPRDYFGMAEKSKKEFVKVWDSFAVEHAREAKKIWKKLDKTLHAMEKRERIRSELTRSLGVIRQWYLKAGQYLGVGDDIFFLEFDEAISALLGRADYSDAIPVRRRAYQRQVDRPGTPFVISGRFDLDIWLKDKNRRMDIFDSHAEVEVEEEAGIIRGQPGSAGRIEGQVRIIHSPSNGNKLKKGEILVASTTNVGWTPIFPMAAAVVTDVGAPLSHAAIIARELGIPAVVGTANATMRLKTGDKVLVDGSQGVVYIK